MDLEQLQVVRNELDNDPEALGYAGKTTIEKADLINAFSQTENVDLIPGWQVFAALDKAEYNAKSDAIQDRLLEVAKIEFIDPFGPIADRILAVFGGGSASITNLAAMRVMPISRAGQLGLPTVKGGHIVAALELP